MMLILDLAYRYLRLNVLRTAMLGGAIAFACLAAYVFISFLNGATRNLEEASVTAVGGHVNVAAVFKPRKERAFYVATDPVRLLKVIEEATPGHVAVTRRLRFAMRITAGDKSVVVPMAQGVDIDAEPRLAETLAAAGADSVATAERPNDIGRLRERFTIVLFSRQARGLGVRVGDTVALRANNLSNVENVVDATVVAVVQDMGRFALSYAFVNRPTMGVLIGAGENAAGSIGVLLPSYDQVEPARVAIAKALKVAGMSPLPALQTTDRARAVIYDSQPWAGEKNVVFSWEDEHWGNLWIIEVAMAQRWLLLIVICVVLGVGVANASLMAARERTPQIGLLRALGAPPRVVLGFIIMEMFLLAVTSAGAGLGLGWLLCHLLNRADIKFVSDVFRNNTMTTSLYFEMNSESLIVLFVALVSVLILGAGIGALRAMKIQPNIALQHTD